MNEWAWTTRTRRKDRTPPLIQKITLEESEDAARRESFFDRIFNSMEVSPAKSEIEQRREGLGELEMTINDLTRRIENLDRIAARWKDRNATAKTRN